MNIQTLNHIRSLNNVIGEQCHQIAALNGKLKSKEDSLEIQHNLRESLENILKDREEEIKWLNKDLTEANRRYKDLLNHRNYDLSLRPVATLYGQPLPFWASMMTVMHQHGIKNPAHLDNVLSMCATKMPKHEPKPDPTVLHIVIG